uniref:PCI domain-containing protein n=1 Tax=Heterosigma akashiwo TaxID=2829 RepID=A0A7S3YM12_HETAK|mmetsp:Transcript_52762/g.90715  ORF Transcript_52762/g.90715 Transcript_52762/m.90715 type:complete len:275 (-) Transcript_52762:333-1157(-)
MKVKGTCVNLEKRYFRLTSAPDPSTVRPPPVLEEAMLRLKKLWKDQEKDYEYVCDQLKAVRQDCTVQQIRDGLAVDVYETHARIALEEGDLNEYNQCQTQLKELYASGAPGHEMEFTAYRVLYYVNMQDNQKNQDGSTEMLKMLKALRPAQRADPAVAHALRVRQAMAEDDYHLFFQLYEDAPNMSAYIMDLMLDKIRVKALQRVVKAYKPTIATDFIQRILAFDSEDECFELLTVVGVKFAKSDGSLIDCKTSTVDPAAWQKFKFEKEKGSLL